MTGVANDFRGVNSTTDQKSIMKFCIRREHIKQFVVLWTSIKIATAKRFSMKFHTKIVLFPCFLVLFSISQVYPAKEINCARIRDYACVDFSGRPQKLYCECSKVQYFNGSHCLEGARPCTPGINCPLCVIRKSNTQECSCSFGKKLDPSIGLDQTLQLDKDICGEFSQPATLYPALR